MEGKWKILQDSTNSTWHALTCSGEDFPRFFAISYFLETFLKFRTWIQEREKSLMSPNLQNFLNSDKIWCLKILAFPSSPTLGFPCLGRFSEFSNLGVEFTLSWNFIIFHVLITLKLDTFLGH